MTWPPPSRRWLLAQAYLAVLLAAVIRCAGHIVQAMRHDPRQVAHARSVDVNRAGPAELQTLPGVGRTRARAIVLHRVRHGRFVSLDALGAVDGIGATTLAGLAPFVRFGPSDPPTDPARLPPGR